MGEKVRTVRIITGEVETCSAAAWGLALLRREAGRRVAVVRFGPAGSPGAPVSAEKLGIDIYAFGRGRKSPDEGWERILELVAGGGYDLLVLEGLLNTVEAGVVSPAEVEALLEDAPPAELILTGRRSPVELVKAVDTVVEMLDIKHR